MITISEEMLEDVTFFQTIMDKKMELEEKLMGLHTNTEDAAKSIINIINSNPKLAHEIQNNNAVVSMNIKNNKFQSKSDYKLNRLVGKTIKSVKEIHLNTSEITYTGDENATHGGEITNRLILEFTDGSEVEL